jgi:hypothetical protein
MDCSDGFNASMGELVSPMAEVAPITGRINPADKKSRRDVLDFIKVPPVICVPS